MTTGLASASLCADCGTAEHGHALRGQPSPPGTCDARRRDRITRHRVSSRTGAPAMRRAHTAPMSAEACRGWELPGIHAGQIRCLSGGAPAGTAAGQARLVPGLVPGAPAHRRTPHRNPPRTATLDTHRLTQETHR